MITRVILGDGTELHNVESVIEIVQNGGDYVYNGLIIDIQNHNEGESVSITEVQEIFSRPNVLNSLNVYRKDEVNRLLDDETGEYIIEYSDEYLSFETSKYVGVKSIYRDIASDRITVSLSVDHTQIADDKYNELVEANEYLRGVIDVLLGGEDNE